MTLLERARAVKPEQPVRSAQPLNDRLELALAWIAGEVTAEQIRAVGVRGNPYSALGGTLVTAARQGLIKISRVKRRAA